MPARLACVFLITLTEYAFRINMELGVLVTGGKLPAQVEEHFSRLIRTRRQASHGVLWHRA